MPPATDQEAAAARQQETKDPGDANLGQPPSDQRVESIPPCLWCTYEILTVLRPNPCYRRQGEKCQPCTDHGRTCEPIHHGVASSVTNFAKRMKDEFPGRMQLREQLLKQACANFAWAETIMANLVLRDRLVAIGAIKNTSEGRPGLGDSLSDGLDPAGKVSTQDQAKKN